MFGKPFGEFEEEKKSAKSIMDKEGHELSEELASHVPTNTFAGMSPQLTTGGVESLLVETKDKTVAE